MQSRSVILMAVIVLLVGTAWGQRIVFGDDMTTFPGAWTLGGTSGQYWTQKSNRWYSSSNSIKCTPSDANYSDNVDVTMTRTISLAGYTSGVVTFWIWQYTESNYDYVQFRYSTDGGSSWSTSWSRSGSYQSWQQITIGGLPANANRLQFRFYSDGSVTNEGAYVDDVVLYGLTTSGTTLFTDDMTNFPANWSLWGNYNWTKVAYSVHSPSYSAKCCPIDGYGYYNFQNNGMDRAFSLAGYSSGTFSFWMYYNTEDGFDYCHVEYRSGGTWYELYNESGTNNSWTFYSYTIPNTADAVRFWFESDGSVTDNGYYVDDVTVSGVNAPPIDMQALAITSPGATVDSGVPVPVTATVRNLSTVTAGTPVYFQTGNGSTYRTMTTVDNIPSGGTATTTFLNWTPNLPPGTVVALKCSTAYSGDMNTGNDVVTGTTTVLFRDAAVSAILSPAAIVDSGSTVQPRARLKNLGGAPVSGNVLFQITDGYSNTQPFSIPVGDSFEVSFANWNPIQRGSFATKCSVQILDANPGNNKLSGTVFVRVKDVGAVSIAVPSGTYRQDTFVTPKATYRNYGNAAASFEAWMILSDPTDARVYARKVDVPNVAPGGSIEIATFPRCTLRTSGSWSARCSAFIAGDARPSNDFIDRPFTVSGGGGPPPPPAQWTARSPMPTGAKPIKDGGWLAYNSGNSRIYGSRGNKQLDFFEYNPAKDSWKALAPWLLGTEGKPPSKGSAGCADGSGVIYATKGNNKQGFYKYYANGDSWRQKKDVPLGLSNKKVKGGTDIVWAYKGTVGSPYLLKGYKNEFYRYDVGGDSWQTLTPAPAGGNVKWDKGSWLAYDGVNKKIYAHKAKYHEFYSYNTETDSWSGALTAMPIAGSAGSKKSKDGGCGAYQSTKVYALKGGGTFEFWRYHIVGDSWGELASMPAGASGKKVKAGADIVSTGTALYATKGNKQNELWTYVPGAFLFGLPERSGVMAGVSGVRGSAFAIAPNPLASGYGVLRYSLPKARAANLSVFNVAGQRVMTQALLGRSGIVNLDLRHVSNGVYLAKLVCDDFACTQKLLVQR